MIKYPAKIKYNRKDKCYYVEFPDLPGCSTFGYSIDEAKNNATEALSGYLESIDARKVKIPTPSLLHGKNIFYIEPEKNVAFAINLKHKRIKSGFSQKDIAKKLKISYQSYQRFENPSKSNPTLKTITKLENVLKDSLVHIW